VRLTKYLGEVVSGLGVALAASLSFPGLCVAPIVLSALVQIPQLAFLLVAALVIYVLFRWLTDRPDDNPPDPSVSPENLPLVSPITSARPEALPRPHTPRIVEIVPPPGNAPPAGRRDEVGVSAGAWPPFALFCTLGAFIALSTLPAMMTIVGPGKHPGVSLGLLAGLIGVGSVLTWLRSLSLVNRVRSLWFFHGARLFGVILASPVLSLGPLVVADLSVRTVLYVAALAVLLIYGWLLFIWANERLRALTLEPWQENGKER
jgi:hypothetical protein